MYSQVVRNEKVRSIVRMLSPKAGGSLSLLKSTIGKLLPRG